MSAPPVVKSPSQQLQKEMILRNYDRITGGEHKVASTFVPGNLNELLMCFDFANNLPEINAIQNALRQRSGDLILEAERAGHSEDVCGYVKADLGMTGPGTLAPNGMPFPPPDVLLLCTAGCFTFMKWFELLRERHRCPTAMLHIPYAADGKPTRNMRDYVVSQLKTEVIPTLERVSGVRFDIDRLREHLRKSAAAEDDLVWMLEQSKRKPSPIDCYFGGVYYMGPIFTAFRGTDEAVEYYRALRGEIEERIRLGLCAQTPEGDMPEEKYRLVVEGPPNWTSFREFWKMFYEAGAVVVASTYTKVGGVYDYDGFRHDPERPLESLADYCMGVYTNRCLPIRVDMISRNVLEYEADGLLINSIKSCNSFSAGQLVMLKEIERRTGKPGAFIETDLVDPRYFSSANVRTRLESYFQMIDQRRGAGRSARTAS